MSAHNPWRGERMLLLPGHEPIVVAASLDGIARLMSATGAETLEALQDALAARRPKLLQDALGVLIGQAEADEVFAHVNGAAGLTAVYAAVSGAVSGLTPEEEEEAKKAQADRERQLEAAALAVLANAVGRSNASPSGNG